MPNDSDYRFPTCRLQGRLTAPHFKKDPTEPQNIPRAANQEDGEKDTTCEPPPPPPPRPPGEIKAALVFLLGFPQPEPPASVAATAAGRRQPGGGRARDADSSWHVKLRLDRVSSRGAVNGRGPSVRLTAPGPLTDGSPWPWPRRRPSRSLIGWRTDFNQTAVEKSLRWRLVLPPSHGTTVLKGRSETSAAAEIPSQVEGKHFSIKCALSDF